MHPTDLVSPAGSDICRMIEHPSIAFLEEKDPWSDVDKVQGAAEIQQIPLYPYPGYNRSLECSYVMQNLSE